MKLNQPDWGDNSHSVALSGELRQEGLLFHLILNAYWEPLDFELPQLAERNRGGAGSTRRSIRRTTSSPGRRRRRLHGDTYRVADRSVVMLHTSSKG